MGWLLQLVSTGDRDKTERKSAPRRSFTPEVVLLEDRITPVAIKETSWPGVSVYNNTQTGVSNLPVFPRTQADTSVAAGPVSVVQTANTEIRLTEKTVGNLLVAPRQLRAFFGLPAAGTEIYNSVVVFNDNINRFAVICISRTRLANGGLGGSSLNVAVSRSQTPASLTAADWIITLNQAAAGAPGWFERAYLGYNATTLTVSLDVHRPGGFGSTGNPPPFTPGLYTDTLIVFLNPLTGAAIRTISPPAATTTVLNTPTNNRVTPSQAMVPARMHAAAGITTRQYFISEGPTPNLRPTLQLPYRVRVWWVENPTTGALRFIDAIDSIQPFYLRTNKLPLVPNGLTRPGTRPAIEVGDTRFASAAWRNDFIVAAQQTQTLTGNEVKVKWLLVSTFNLDVSSDPGAVIAGGGYIDPGRGLHTYLPAIEIARNNDIGLIFVQSSVTQPMTIYVTGARLKDKPLVMQTPYVLVANGSDNLTDSLQTFPNVGPRAGRYGDLAVDPVAGSNSFWGTNQYTTSPGPASRFSNRFLNNWLTQVVRFYIGIKPTPNTVGDVPNGPPEPVVPPNPLQIFGPVRWVQGANNTFSGILTLVNYGPTVTGPFIITMNLPDVTVRVLGPKGVSQSGRTATYLYRGDLLTNQPVRLNLVVRNPRKVSLGTFFFGIAGKIE